MTALRTAAAACLMAAAMAAQEPRISIPQRPRPRPPSSEETPREPTIRVDTSLVLIPVTVMDPFNRLVTGLERGDFRVFEEGTEQKFVSFASEEAPMSMGLVFDTSGSMGEKLRNSREALAQLMRTANDEDEFFLVQFSDRPQIMADFTKNTGEILERARFTKSKGSTALVDAIYLAVSRMKNAQNPRKAIVIISDGGDNHSRYSVSQMKNLVREADVQIYAMGLFGGGMRTPEEISGPELLTHVCEQTGGQHFAVGNPVEMADIANKIAIELRSQYVLGYAPSNKARDGKYRRVKVKLIQPRGMPPLRAYWRHGYYAPGQ